ncbi:fatty acyl-AMP ligase [Gloeocapsa sp. PCC 73106]|uniref:fatty acyl-AMP ligase n=1 Tax=Gloeocapsa sp. PCC 73106 TaxID=102232 RepID=UPI0002ACE59E|nr:fatty acyl-AMP ligase [Gloeocapsa sp. PCC 73106]ELR97341.1 acyl-CoA synthetase (AMP-forming)/AMP-acid ligase II [Gloeocapsa sp. PCC 73106]
MNLINLTLIDLLETRAKHQGNEIAYRFCFDGEVESDSLTYRTLADKAKAIASYLQSLQLEGERVIIIYPYDQALEFIIAFFGCLYAGVVVVTCHPPLSRHGFQEIQTRLQSSQGKAIITNSNLISKLKKQIKVPENNFHWLITADISDHLAHNWIKPPIEPTDLAFLQYTSGSTGTPKGVMLTHQSIIYNQKMLQLGFANTENSIGVTWLPLFHDMGLIGQVIQALYLGRPSIFMSPIAFIQKPVRWLQAISRYRGTVSGGPNFGYDLLCRHVTPQQKANLDLSCWEVAFCGAEPIRLETIDRFCDLFKSCGFRREAFYTCYGMAEATLFVTGSEKNKLPAIKYIQETALQKNQVILTDKPKADFFSLVSCGKALLDQRIIIVDPESLTRCSTNQIGEIWVSGSGIGQGYWNDRDRTQATFQAYTKDTQEGPFLRTGDLGFLLDQELFITGRLNDVMVFWGLNHYPQLIEETVVSSHPALRVNCNAAVSVFLEGQYRLIILQEIERGYRNNLDVDEIFEKIRWEVFAKHLVDVYAICLLKTGSIPKTSSGKIQRQASKSLFLNNNLDIIAQWTSPPREATDMTSVFQRYLNPFTHLKRYLIITKAKLKHLFS